MNKDIVKFISDTLFVFYERKFKNRYRLMFRGDHKNTKLKSYFFKRKAHPMLLSHPSHPSH